MAILLMILYGVCMLFMMLFSLVQMHLALTYKKSYKSRNNDNLLVAKLQRNIPFVTVQLPVFNEIYVIERLIDAVATLNWPAKKLEIQILDDSTDKTTDIIQKKLEILNITKPELKFIHTRRPDRSGFKAGALQYGLNTAIGEFVAIFDADFLPDPEFLLKTIPFFQDDAVGMVQTKWEHLNKNYSLLTKLQDFGLNGHFSVEQTGRSVSGSFINFNGTAGVWRKKCIVEADGWQKDTLTEDLDLSYRAQLLGWKFKYLEKVESPAELPVMMSAVKSQQFRWTKGGAETARKNLFKVLKAPMYWKNKIHAFFHLTNSANFLFLLVASLLSIPLLYVKYKHPELKTGFDVGGVFIFGFLAISYFYWIATKYNNPEPRKTYFKYFPLFMIFSMGLSFHNGIAVLEGLLGIKSPFIRTPKFNIIDSKNTWIKNNFYVQNKINWSTLFEAFLSLYFLSGIVVGFLVKDYGLMLFHLMLTIGYAVIFFFSIKKYTH